MLIAAKALGVDNFEAFPNLPPSWFLIFIHYTKLHKKWQTVTRVIESTDFFRLTRNGCTKGTLSGAPLHDNFDPANSAAFADYLTEVVKYYNENHGITFTSLMPFNEPSSGYWKGENSTQEGCNVERSTMVEVIKSVNASLQIKNMGFCKLSVADETNFGQEMDTQKYFVKAGISGLYSKVNTHG